MQQDTDYRYYVRKDTVDARLLDWVDTCTRTIEMFGLPGGRYIVVSSNTCSEFRFKDKADAIKFALACL